MFLLLLNGGYSESKRMNQFQFKKDFAFVITNGASQRRKFVLYRFSSEEDPVFVYEEDAPDYGDIMSVNKSGSDGGYRVKYTN